MHVRQHLVFRNLYGGAEVNDFERVVEFFVDQHVFRLDVAVDDVEVVEVSHGLQDLLYYVCSVAL